MNDEFKLPGGQGRGLLDQREENVSKAWSLKTQEILWILRESRFQAKEVEFYLRTVERLPGRF